MSGAGDRTTAPGTVEGAVGKHGATKLFAGYLLEGRLGAGGMGVVYLAREPALARAVALKLVAPDMAANPIFRALFLQESHIAASLEHPHVIPIYGAGEHDGQLFLAMRYVEGGSLEELIARRGCLPPTQAARLVGQVSGALDAAHARGLVHRDVKPGNVMLAGAEGEEHAYLTDFGLAAPASEIRPSGGRGGGTLAYLAPEQIRGGVLDARTDVYALGCLLYHALTGRPPYVGKREEVLVAHLTAPSPRATAVAPWLPGALDAVVARALAKRPEERFASAGELAAAAAMAARFDAYLLHAPQHAPSAARLAAALVARGLEVWLEETRRSPGGEAAHERAEGLRGSRALAVLVGPEGLVDVGRSELALSQRLAQREPALRRVAVLLPGANELQDPRLAFLGGWAWADLRADPDDADAIADLVHALRGERRRVPAPSGAVACPYRGLEAFGPEHADLFVGRETEVARGLQRLRSGRFLAVMGPSGSGKTSLVRAGLLPALTTDGLPGSSTWPAAVLRVGDRPLAALARALAVLGLREHPPDLAELRDERTLDEWASAALVDRPRGVRLVVAVDQLEEAFTLCQDAEERGAFLSALRYAATIPGGRVMVIALMRADFYGRLGDAPDFAALAENAQLLVGAMGRDHLRRVIEEPAARAGLELEEGLTRRILADVADRPGSLPLLSYLLLALWERRRGRTLTLEAYAAVGGVEGALARRANAVYQSLTPARRRLARRLLLRLVQPGEGSEDTRRRGELRELVLSPGEESEVRAVLEAFAAARLLTAGRDPASGHPTVDIAHEALIRAWPDLRTWLAEEREALRLERRLSEAAGEWEAGGRDEALLYGDARLSLWAERDPCTLPQRERDFLAASRARVDRQRRAQRRRVIATVGGLATALIVVGAVAGLALWQRGVAAGERDRAQSRQLAANAQGQLTSDSQLSLLLALRAYHVWPTQEAAEVLRQAAHDSRLLAELPLSATGWTAQFSPDGREVLGAGEDGRNRLWNHAGHGRAVWRGQDGYGFTSVDVARDGSHVIGSTPEEPVVRVWSVERASQEAVLPGGRPHAVRFSSDGRFVVVGESEGTVRVWDWRMRRELALLRGHHTAVDAVAFSPNGRLVASAGADGAIRLSEWRTGRVRMVLRGHRGPVSDLEFAADGRELMSSAADGTARVWDTTSGRTLALLRSPVRGGVSAALSPVGTLVAVGQRNGAVAMWDWARRRRLGSFVADGPVFGVRFSSDGSRLMTVTGGQRARVAVWNWRARRSLATLAGAGHVASATFARDDQHLVTAGGDGTLRFWDLADPSSSRLLGRNRPRPLFESVFSPDGRSVASVGSDGTVRIFDRTEPGSVKILRSGGGPLYAAAFSPDGRRLAVGGSDRKVRVWDWARGRLLTILPHRLLVWDVAFSRDGRRIVTATPDPVVRVWDWRRDRLVMVLRGHSKPVVAARFTGDGGVASASEDQTVLVWDPEGRRTRRIRNPSGPLFALAVSRDARFLATGDALGDVRVWAWRSGQLRSTLRGPQGNLLGLDFSPDGRALASTGIDAKLRLWEWGRGERLLGDHAGPVSAVLFSPDARWVATGGDDGSVRIWDPAGQRPGGVLGRHRAPVTALVYSRAARRLASSSRDGTVSIWDPAGRSRPTVLRGHRASITSVAFSPDGRRLASAGDDGTVRIWDRAGRSPPIVLRGHRGSVTSVAFSPDGTRIASAGGDGDPTIRLWDVGRARVVQVLRGHTLGLFHVEFTRDGRRILSVGADSHARVWDVGEQREPRVLQGQSGHLAMASFSPDGRQVVGVGDDAAVRVWSAGVSGPGTILGTHSSGVLHVTYGPRGDLVATTGRDGSVRVWDPRRVEAVLVFRGHRGDVPAVAFSPNGRTLVSGGADGKVRLWSCDVCGQIDDVVALARRRAVRALTPGERAAYLAEGE